MTIRQISLVPAALDLIVDEPTAPDGLLWAILLVILAVVLTVFVVSRRKK